MDDEGRLVRAGSFNGAAAAIRAGLAALVIPALLGRLGPEGFGVWAFVNAAAGTAGVVDLGTAAATSVFVANALGRGDRGAARTAVANGRAIALCCALFSALLVVSLAPFAANVLDAKSSSPGSLILALRLSSIYVLVRLTLGAWLGVEEGLLAFREKSFLAALESLLGSGTLLVTVAATRSIVALIISQIGVALLVGVAHVITVRRLLRRAQIEPWVVPTLRGASGLGRMGLGSLVGSISSSAFSQADRLMVGAMWGPVPLATYAAVVSLAAQGQTLCVSFLQPVVATASRLSGDARGTLNLARRTFWLGAISTTMAMSAGVVAVPFAGRFVKSLAAVPPLGLVVGISSYGLLALSGGPFYLLVARRRTALVSVINSIAVITTLLVMFLLLRLHAKLNLVVAVNAIYGLITLSLLWFLPEAQRALTKPLLIAGIGQVAILIFAGTNLARPHTVAVCIGIACWNGALGAVALVRKWSIVSGRS